MTDNEQPMMTVNMELVDKVFKHLHKRNNWNQRGWMKTKYNDGLNVLEFLLDQDAETNTCGFTMCFGGWACAISGNVAQDNESFDGFTATRPDKNGEPQYTSWFAAAAFALGFNPYLAELVFFNYAENLDEFERTVRSDIEKYGKLTRREAMRMHHNYYRSEYGTSTLFNDDEFFKGIGGDERFTYEPEQVERLELV